MDSFHQIWKAYLGFTELKYIYYVAYWKFTQGNLREPLNQMGYLHRY